MPRTKCPSSRRIPASAGDRPSQPGWWGSKMRGNEAAKKPGGEVALAAPSSSRTATVSEAKTDSKTL
eukprot:7097707-Pyramimonas_sp.AAC.1